MDLKCFISLTLICQIHIEVESHCYSTLKNPYLYFSTKTSYEASRASKMDTHTECTPIYLWALIRHGTRYASLKSFQKMKKLEELKNQIVSNHAQGRGELCKEDLDKITRWQFHLTENLNSELCSQGKSDHSNLAKRLKKKFPKLLGSGNKEDFMFKYSGMKRTKDSSLAFTNQLLGTEFDITEGNNITEDLPRICPNYQENVKRNLSTYREQALFTEGDEMRNVIIEVGKRLGFISNLTYNDIYLMYHDCAYENAWYVNSRPAFCSAFTEDNMKVLEYSKDLRYYYLSGYGHPINKNMSCCLVRDLLTILTNVSESNGKAKQKASIYFSHSEVILPTTVKLGLNRDEESLRHDNFEKMKNQRKWRLAIADSFAANIIAVLYKCPQKFDDEYQIVFYQNEHEVILPMCPGSPCSLKFLRAHFADVFNESICDLNFCSINSSQSLYFVITLSWSIILSLCVLLLNII